MRHRCGLYQKIYPYEVLPIIIKEIRQALDSSMWMTALTSSLVLPDMCAHVEKYIIEGRNDKGSKSDYVKWVDKYVKILQVSCVDDDEKFPVAFDGELLYTIRCNVLHEGLPYLDTSDEAKNKMKSPENKIDDFHFIIDPATGGWSGEVGYCENDITGEKFSRKISIQEICSYICDAAEDYYKKNKELFYALLFTNSMPNNR